MSSFLKPVKSRYSRNITKQQMAAELDAKPTAFQLFKRTFSVVVPAAHMYTDADFEKGVVVTGDKDADAKSAHERIVAYLPIAPDETQPAHNILEFFEQDIPCEFRYEKDVNTVYDIIMRHFKDMGLYLNENPLMNPTKRERIIEDLRRFDVLAAKLHPQAHTILPRHLKSDSIENRLRLLLRPAIVSQDVREAEQTATEKLPDYKSFEVGLSASILKGNKRWQ